MDTPTTDKIKPPLQECAESIKERFPLLTGIDSHGRLIIKKGDQEIVVLPYERKILLKILVDYIINQ